MPPHMHMYMSTYTVQKHDVDGTTEMLPLLPETAVAH